MQHKSSAPFLPGILLVFLLAGCAHDFPRPDRSAPSSQTGAELFAATLRGHGGDHLHRLEDVNVGLAGDWKFLITRIQPLVTDHKYRVRSQERLLPGQGVYAVRYEGPAGAKSVFRSPREIAVGYDGVPTDDQDVLASTALTADAFYLFLLGPLALAEQEPKFIRLEDVREDGRTYQRVYAELTPGFGYSKRDELVLWIDPETSYVFRVEITLEGYETTRGAHVDVTYLDYELRDGFVFPSRFLERVRAPIAINAHEWHLTGLDINRGYAKEDLKVAEWARGVASPAAALSAVQIATAASAP